MAAHGVADGDAGMVEVRGRIARHAEFLHDPAGADVRRHGERNEGGQAKDVKSVAHDFTGAFGGISAAPEFMAQPPADFDGGHEGRFEAWHEKAYEAHEGPGRAMFGGPQAESVEIEVRLNAVEEILAFFFSEKAGHELHDARVGVHFSEGQAVFLTPGTKDEAFGGTGVIAKECNNCSLIFTLQCRTMKILGLVAIILCFSSGLWAEDRTEAPVQVLKVEPDYSSLQTGYVVEVAELEMTLDARGVPFSLKSSVGLPDNVVQALSQWRYEPLKKNGHATASLLKMSFGFRRAITPVLERSIFPRWKPVDEKVRDAVERGKRMTADEAAQMEGALPEAEALEHGRTSLLIYYSKGLPDAAKAREGRARLIPWLIEHYPEDEILGSPAAIINAAGEPLADAGAQDKAKELWAKAVASATHDIPVAEHAANFFQAADPSKAAAVLRDLGSWPKRNVWLGRIYALQALGVKTLDPESGDPVAALGEPSAAAREGLLKATDSKAVLSAMAAIRSAHFSLAKADRWTPSMQQFCEQFLAHEKEIYPAAKSSCDASKAEPNGDVLKAVSLGGHTAQPHLRKKMEPRYPPEAKYQMVQGTVRLSAIIDENGRIQELGLIEGPLVLYGASRKAVSQWEFDPATEDGQPVAIATKIEVNFALGH